VNLLPCFNIPENEGRGTGEGTFIVKLQSQRKGMTSSGEECHLLHTSVMAIEADAALPALQVPDDQTPIPGGGDGEVPIRGNDEIANGVGMTLKAADSSPGLQIPQKQGVVSGDRLREIRAT
jgi:hypothetical protein